MEGTTNQDSKVDAKPKNCTHQSSKKSPRPTSISKDTNKINVVQNSENQVLLRSRSVDTDEIEVLRGNSTWSEDKVRQLITICVFCLFVIYVMVGLVMFIVSGKFTLLLSSPVLTIPILKVMSFYFYRPKEK